MEGHILYLREQKKRKKIARTFDKEGNKVSETEIINDVDKEDIKNNTNLLSKDRTNSMHNNTVGNQDDINNSEMTEIGEIRQSETEELKDDEVYILNSMGDIVQDKQIKCYGT